MTDAPESPDRFELRGTWKTMPAWERVMERLIPDAKGWLALWAAMLVMFLLEMIRENPRLLSVSSFMQFAGVLAGGTFLVLYGHYFGGTKAGSDVMVAQSKAQTGTGAGGAPMNVRVANPPSDPVPTTQEEPKPDPFKIG